MLAALYQRRGPKQKLRRVFFDPSRVPDLRAKLEVLLKAALARLLHTVEKGGIEPLAGAGKVVVDTILRRARYPLSADWRQHKAYTGVGRPGRYTLSKDPQALVAYDGRPGGITTLHAAATPKLPWSTPVVEEITDPVLVRQILAEHGEALHENFRAD